VWLLNQPINHDPTTLVSSPLQVKICDFGLAKYSASALTTKHLTSATASARTLEYSSPERLRRGRHSKQDDVYAFGVLLYFVATSRSPYSGISAKDVERIVENGERPEIDEWEEAQGYGPELQGRLVAPYCELARQCWHERPAERPAFNVIYSRLENLTASAS
jgi:fibroblast growth factor receptor 2